MTFVKMALKTCERAQMLTGPPLFSVSMGRPVQPNSIAARTAEEAKCPSPQRPNRVERDIKKKAASRGVESNLLAGSSRRRALLPPDRRPACPLRRLHSSPARLLPLPPHRRPREAFLAACAPPSEPTRPGLAFFTELAHATPALPALPPHGPAQAPTS
ncbi:hypothetical protein PVAP13_9KG417301 [Panicum virgatum]|uniref:Uncharacterized protein n=1 Tax=Panicum virgatum TaxID=38727 RepID=A0A8T0N7T2_PANVG|nr:hypothetical protein PVAP13_9KG417301 [Panicum virgatum]